MSKWVKVRLILCGAILTLLALALMTLAFGSFGELSNQNETEKPLTIVVQRPGVTTFKSAAYAVEPSATFPPVVVFDPMEEWYYYLSPEHQDLIERVVMAESGNQSLLGQQAVAQCILNQGQISGLSPIEVVTEPGQYTAPYSGEVSLQTKEAVYLVFHDGTMAVNDTLQYFYSLATGNTSSWHESKTWVCTIGAHKFFKE